MFGCPLVQWTQPRNPWEGPAGALLRVGDLVAAGRECVPTASYAPVGPFSRLEVAGPTGAICPWWRVARVTPRGLWIHGSGPLHRRTADCGHSFGCQQDEPSASLVTTKRTSMCIDLLIYAVDCCLLGITLLLLLSKGYSNPIPSDSCWML